LRIITSTGDDRGYNTTGKVYVLSALPQCSKAELYKHFKAELYKVIDDEYKEKLSLLGKKWYTGGSRRNPFSYCISVYEIMPEIILGWSLIKWGYSRGKSYPEKKVEGVSPVSLIPSVPLEQRVLEAHALFGVFVDRSELKIENDYFNDTVRELFDELKPVTAPSPPSTQGMPESRVSTAV
jgi:hypothetical protein